jgi:DNA-binding NtrC family response regulator
VHILVVEDYAALASGIARTLRRDQHTVEIAPTVAEAYEWMLRVRFDVILSDFEIQDHRTGNHGNGVEVLRHAALAQPWAKRPFMSGNPDAPKALAHENVTAHFVQKPFAASEIRRLVASLVDSDVG